MWRRRGRTVLMLVQLVSAFALFGVLQGADSGIKQVLASLHGNRLYITSRVAVGDPLPVGLLTRIRSLPGVRAVTPRAVFVGTYRRPDQRVPVIAADVEPFFRIYDELSVAPRGAVQALKSARAGAIVGQGLITRYGWKIGDRFTLQSPLAKRDGSRDWEFDVVGVYGGPENSRGTPPSTAVVVNFDYVNEARATGADRADMFLASVRDAKEAGVVSLAIDNAFANSDHETRTQSESDFLTTQMQKTVDLDFIVRAVVAAVFFALLLATGLLMMQSLRERTPELAVLKTLGFSDRRLFALILAESITLCVLGAAIGLAVGAALLSQARPLVGVTRMPAIVAAAGMGCAVLIAFIAGAAPAVHGSRLQVADALAVR